MTKIRTIDDSALCISRRKYGKGYQYFDEHNKKITNQKTLKRLKELVIPPMWKEVMICRFDDGHIQAIGRDLKGRKQYIYHSAFEKLKQEEKFNRMVDFAEKLPEIRKQAHHDLHQKGWKKAKVLALMMLILDEYGIRIGNKQYQKRNNTFGLTTLRRKHFSVEEEELVFSFIGKSGKEREVHIDDEELIPFIRKSAEMPGYEIFRYKDDNNQFCTIDSEEVNEYIHHYIGNDFSSKDFRTWTASRLAVEFYPIALEESEGSRKKFSNIVIKMVADELGNTPTVCRNYYVHPKLFNTIDQKAIPTPNPFKDSENENGLSKEEKLALEIIKKG